MPLTMNKPRLRILYFGITAPDKSMRDVPYIKALKQKGVTFLECYDTTRGFGKYWALIQKFRPFRGQFDVVWVGHTSALAVPLARALTRKPILYNALCPQYDGNVVDRATYSPLSPRAILIWLIDFFSMHAADALLLETNEQIKNVQKTFFVSRRKLYRVFTTVDPEHYRPDPSVQKAGEFTCVFRAWLTPATGTEYIVEAARLLRDKDVKFRFMIKGPLVEELKKKVVKEQLANIDIDTTHYEFKELCRRILEGHVYLGQFSDHARTARTIQFKTVEACAFGLPYITADLPSNRELLADGENCIFVPARNPEILAQKILLLKENGALRDSLGHSAHDLYKRKLHPDVLSTHILDIIEKLRA